MSMHLMGKKPDVSLIIEKMNKPSENSSDELKSSNEKYVEAPTNAIGDEIDSSTAESAAAQALSSALESKDPKAMASAIKELFELFSLGKD